MNGLEDGVNDFKKNNYRSCIKIDKEIIINQAFQLHKSGHIKEAKKLYEKIIDRGIMDIRVMTNYGIILKESGENEKAIKIYKDAIKFNPKKYIAYFNLGNLLRDYGELSEAKYYFEKAIEVQPDLRIAYINLAKVLALKGEIEKSNKIYLQCLNFEDINIKNKVEINVNLLINYLLIGNFEKVKENTIMIKRLIKKANFEQQRDANIHKSSISYVNFIEKLYPLLNLESNDKISKKIPHIGESHCLSFSYERIIIDGKVRTIQPVLIQGGKAWHFCNSSPNKWKDSLNEQLKYHKYSEEVFISFGEIDCRKNEGILHYSEKHKKNEIKVCQETIKGYINYMESLLPKFYKNRYYLGVPAPTAEEETNDKADKRKNMIEAYNQILKKEVTARKAFFLDVYNLTVNSRKENNNKFMADSIHLSPKYLELLFKKN